MKPIVVVSKCLGFAHCRYNGEIIEDPFVRRLRDFVEFRPVCPEMEIGLGVPRDPIRVVLVEGRLRLVQPTTGKEFSEQMNGFAEAHLSGLAAVDGFLLKSRSPSCGTRDVRIYNETGNVLPSSKRQGLFGAAALARFPLLPVEDEGRLKNFLIRERFLAMLFTLTRFRELAGEPTMARLTSFHARHKLLLLAYNEPVMRQLGRVGANEGHKPVAEVFREYGRLLPLAFASPPLASRSSPLAVRPSPSWLLALGFWPLTCLRVRSASRSASSAHGSSGSTNPTLRNRSCSSPIPKN